MGYVLNAEMRKAGRKSPLPPRKWLRQFSQPLALAIMLLAAPAFATDSATSQVDYGGRISQHARQVVERYAQAHGWVNYEAQVDAWMPGPADSQPACVGEVTAEPARPEGRLWGRVPYIVRCSNPNWEVRARAEVSLVVPVVTARHKVSKGQVLDHRTLTLTPKDLAGVYTDFVTDVRQLSGLRAKRALRSGQVISMNQVIAPLLVERGSHVVVRVVADGIEASMTGEALQDGVKGEAIKVRNHSSGKVITAWVAEKGIVETRF